MKRLLLLLAPLAVIAAGPALACSYAEAPEAVGDSSARFFARRMVEAAAFVDLVLVEDDGTRPMNEASTGVLTLRSIAHLKGDGPDRFSLFGTGLTLHSDTERVLAAPLQHFTGEDGRVTTFPYNEERQGRLFPQNGGPPPPPPPVTSCSPNPIAGQTGRFYVVMRGPDGRLLRELALHPGVRAPGFAFVPVTLERDDVWLGAVSRAAFSLGRTDGAAVLQLRDGADPAQIEAALRRAGVIPVAAFVRSGDWLDEVRPSDIEARAGWLTRALPLVVQRNRTALGDPDHGGAEFLRRKLGFEQTFGGPGYYVAQAFTTSVRRKQAVRGAPPRLSAIALAGSAEAIASVQREPFALGLQPLPARTLGLPTLPGATEAERFAALQAIDRDIWLLNGGGGNRQGTLPDASR